MENKPEKKEFKKGETWYLVTSVESGMMLKIHPVLIDKNNKDGSITVYGTDGLIQVESSELFRNIEFQTHRRA